MAYSTTQQRRIVRCLQERPQEALTAGEIAGLLRQEAPPVGLATVYRQLDHLAQEGRIHRLDTEEGAVYQFCAHAGQGGGGCLLLRCRACGRVDHLDCTHLEALYRHLETAHHFTVDLRGTALTGLCSACRGEEEDYGAR